MAHGQANDAASCVAPGWGREQETAPLEFTPRAPNGPTLPVTAVGSGPHAPGCATLLERNGDAIKYVPTGTAEPTEDGA